MCDGSDVIEYDRRTLELRNSPLHMEQDTLHQYTSTPVHQYTSIPVYQYTSTPVHQYTSTPVYQYTSIAI